MKKLAAAIVSFALALALPMAAFAADSPAVDTNKQASASSSSSALTVNYANGTTSAHLTVAAAATTPASI